MISPLWMDLSWKRVHLACDGLWCPPGSAFQRETWWGFADLRVTWRTVWGCRKHTPHLRMTDMDTDAGLMGLGRGAQNPGVFLTESPSDVERGRSDGSITSDSNLFAFTSSKY